jgi:membrane-associated phospholipid phosphatase
MRTEPLGGTTVKGKAQAIAKTGQWLSGIDKITLAYCLWVVAYMIIGITLGRAVKWEVHLPRYVSIIVLVFLLAWWEQWIDPAKRPNLLKVLQFLRAIYPVLLFGYFYTSLYSVNLILFPNWLDPWFMKIDKLIFGYYPSLVWGQTYSNWFLQEFFHFAYFCYYPMIAGLPVYLYYKNKPAFNELIFNLTFVFYGCYVFYSLVPVIGGRYIPEALRLAHAYDFGPFTRIMAFIYNNSGHWGGAFPSSHIAIAIVLTIAALKFVRKWGYVFCIIVVFLSLATVYCHYHWFIDAVAGVFTGILGYYAGTWVRKKLQRD